MGGILRKLVENENEIIVAYMTSGNIAVFDHDVRRYVDFLERLAAEGKRRRDARRARCATKVYDFLERQASRATSTSPRSRTSSASSAKPRR